MWFEEFNSACENWKALRRISYYELACFYVAKEQGEEKVMFFCTDSFCLTNISNVFWYNKPEGVNCEIYDDDQKRFYENG